MTFVKASETNELLQYPASMSDLRRSFPNTSFPKNLDNIDLSEFGYYPIINQSSPEYNPDTQYIRETNPVYSNGSWNQTWEIVSYTAEELTNIEASKAENIRKDRNLLLANSDWTQLADNGLSDTAQTAWRSYRQELRNLPQQSGFPSTVTWPEEPS